MPAGTNYESLDGSFVGYPVSTAVDGSTNYIVLDSVNRGAHVLYVSTDDGRSWQKRSTLPLQDEKWYGALTLMENGGLLAGAYDSDDEYHFYYCISTDQGRSWSEQRKGARRQEGARPRAGLPWGAILSAWEIGELR